MEQNFQTSFIPKKPIIEEEIKPVKSTGFFLSFAVIMFLTVVISYAGLYFYETVLTNNIKKMKDNLALSQRRFEVNKIQELQLLDKRLNASNEILTKHLTISPIFELLQEITMKSVWYNNFSYEIEDKILVKMSGQATDYRAIALQADLFSQKKQLIDPVFSNLTLNEKGDVIFDLEFSVDPDFVNYKQTLERERTATPEPSNIIPAGAGEEN